MYGVDTRCRFMEIRPPQLQLLLKETAELGAITALTKIGRIKPYLNKAQAYKRYGRKNVERWLELGLIYPIKDGANSAACRFNRIELEVLSRAINLLRYTVLQ